MTGTSTPLRTVWLCGLLLMGLGVTTPPSRAASLEEIAALARSGAVELATALVERHQPPLESEPAAWLQWERMRLELYRTQGAWKKLSTRVADLPATLPEDFRRWSSGQEVSALLSQGRGAEARAHLRRLVWFDRGEDSEQSLAAWRRAVIRSYLVDGLVEDARIAMQRYRLDYGDGSDEWRLLQAQVMLRAGAPDEAATLLKAVAGIDARILSLLSELRGGLRRASLIAHEARKLASEEGLSPSQQVQAWALAAEAASVAKDAPGLAEALEQALAQPGEVDHLAGVLNLDPDDLWEAYLSYGQQTGNRAQLLLGQDQAWFDRAAKVREKYPLRARALYAVIALQGSDPEMRRTAHLQLAQSITARSGGERILQRLYLKSKRFARYEAIPAPVRHHLVDLALEASEISLASQLMRGLTTPPAGIDRIEWEMRRARVLILGGEPQVGAEVLGGLLAATPRFEGETLDRLLQVVFDLQTVGHHEAALALFGQIAAKPLDGQRRRELLFWMADSYRALARHQEAAFHYLRSATLLDPFSMDRWAQTARYQAARELGSAGLYRDAQRLFRSLLNATRDTGRRAVLKREIQQLQLKERAGRRAEATGRSVSLR
ncbi:MAG: hypothetical protein Kow006_19280 [Gammaproteobacteria bacterium]